MDRVKSNILTQWRRGVNHYRGSSLDDFVKNRNKVSHGSNGITIGMEGNYSISITPEMIGMGLAIVMTQEEIQTESQPIFQGKGILEQFPYNEEGFNILVKPELYVLKKIKPQELIRKSIMNPALMYNKKMGNFALLTDINITQKKRKNRLVEKLSFKPVFGMGDL